MTDGAGRMAASFRRTSGWFSSGAFVLDNQSEYLDTYELVAVVMGVHAINKRRNAANSVTLHKSPAAFRLFGL